MPDRQTIQPTDHGKTLISWRFPEVPRYQRSRGWYIGMSVFVLLVLVWSIYDRNPLFAIIIVLAFTIIIFQSRQKPNILTINITEDGVEIAKNFYAYDDLARFWIIYKPPLAKTLYLRFKSSLRPVLGIPLEGTDPVKLRRELLRFLSEDLEKEEEPASDAVGRLFKI
ncbi:MAG: hypothetical protein HY420_02905 [Candidatus Kerfeldbacteria bacterium]|nr:hypothetical protein [Candidatus Kerfeldbacteria bacterium]